MNHWILFLHVVAISALTLLALRSGKETLIAWLSLMAVISNLFVTKQIDLFGGAVTCSDPLAVGFLLGLTLLQEYFGRTASQKTIWIAFFLTIGFVILSQLHLLYKPHPSDHTHLHFSFILHPIPRLMIVSFFCFWIVQKIDLLFFSFLRKKWEGKYFAFRSFLSVSLAQLIDTILFSFLALAGQVDSLSDIIFFSLLVKLLTLILAIPFVAFSKKMVSHESVSF